MLKSDNIALRAMEPFDVDVLYEWENDSKLWHLSNTVIPFSRFILEQYILNSKHDLYSDKQLRLIIDLKTDKDFKTIGAVDLFDFDPVNKRAGIGIMISQEERGNGYASIAIDILINYAFMKLDLHQIYANILDNNEESLALFINKGFISAGIKKDWILINNKWHDEYTMQLLRTKH